MRKLFALYRNEMTKLFHKVSILVLTIVMLVCVIGYCGLSFLSSKYSSYVDSSFLSTMDEELSYWQEEKATLEFKLEAAKAASETDAYQDIITMQDDLEYANIQIYVINKFKEVGLDRYTSGDFKSQAIEQISDYMYSLISLQRSAESNSEAKAAIEIYNGYIQRLESIIDNNDYKAFIEFSKEAANADSSLSKEEIEINNEYYDLLYLNDPTGSGDVDGLTAALDTVKDERLSLYTGLNQMSYSDDYGMPISVEDRAYITNQLAVDLYNIENGYLGLYDSSSSGYEAASSFNSCITVGMVFIAIMIMIVAGTSISQEISTGSIKSLIIAPVKRWKIMTAKLLSVLTVIVIETALLFVVSLGISTVTFGTAANIPYVYAVDGVVSEIPPLLYSLASVGICTIEVVVYAVFALMLSTVSRSSALSVGLSIGTYFGFSNIISILVLTAKGEWIKFLPFQHFELQSRIFQFSPLHTSSYAGLLFGTLLNSKTSIMFSIIYLSVLTFTLLLTTYDSFNHRDIK